MNLKWETLASLADLYPLPLVSKYLSETNGSSVFSTKNRTTPMSMDSAMDSLSTASDHSVASAPPSPQYNSKSAVSPHNNNNSNNNHNMSASNNSNTTSSNHHHHHNHNRSPSPVSPPLRHHQGSPHMMSMAHPLSPPQTSTPNSIAAAMGPRMAQSLPHLAPHSLGLLNSLQMMRKSSFFLVYSAFSKRR